MRIKNKLIGKRFGRLTVIEETVKNNKVSWLCICDCGNRKIVNTNHLLSGFVKSCGCLAKEGYTKHGMAKSRFWQVWMGIKNRCFYNTNPGYKYYKGRGIKICKKWLEFKNFRDDMYKSYLKHCKEFGEKNTFIDRINNDGNYLSKNCRWVTRKENNDNKRKKYNKN